MPNLYNVPLQNGIQRTLANTLNAGEVTTITFATSVSSVLQASASIPGTLVIDRVDANGNLTPSLTEYISFTGVSGSTVTGLVRGLAGTSDIAHSIGAIVEFVPDVTWADAINDTFTVGHNADGTHKSTAFASLVSVNLVNSSLDTFTFQSGFSTVSGATQGSMLTFNAGTITNLLVGGIDKSLSVSSTASGLLPTWDSVYLHKVHRQGSNATNYVSGGSVNYLETDVIFQSGAINCVGMTTAGSTKTVTFPKAYTQIPMVWLQFYDATNSHYDVVGNLRSPTTTGFTIINSQGGIGSSSIYLWFALGK